MLRYFILGLFLLATVAIAYVGCGPRMQVAGEKVLKKIDSILNEMDVQLKKIEIKKADLTQQTDAIKDKLYHTEGRLELMREEQQERETTKANLEKELLKLKELLLQAKESGEVKVNDKVISKEELMAWAKTRMKRIKRVNQTNGSKANLIKVYEKNVALYKNQVAVSKKSLEKLSDQIDEIKAKKEALDDTRKATLLEGKSVSINDEFDSLGKDVDELLISVDASLKLERDKLEERISDMDSTSGEATLDELLSDKSDVENTLSEIDELFGDSDQ